MKINKFKKKSKQIIYHKKENHTIERKNNGMTTLYFGYPARISRREEREEKKTHHCKFYYMRRHWTFQITRQLGLFGRQKLPHVLSKKYE